MEINPNNYVEQVDGTKYWYKDGLRHRADGPAVEWANGDKEWWKNGLLHRADGPAVEWADGGKEWYKNGLRHRADGPAYEGADGDKEWYKNDQLHREDGPAVEGADGTKAWYLNGNSYKEENYWKAVGEGKKEEPVKICTVCPECREEGVALQYCAAFGYAVCHSCFNAQFEPAIDHPKHYKDHPFCECIDIVEHMNFNLGCAVKYIWRAGKKGDRLEDLNKAKWYIEREIQRIQKYEDK